MLRFFITALWLLALETVFFFPDVTGSAWAEGKAIYGVTGGYLLLVTLANYSAGYVMKSLLQSRFSSMLLLDIAMAMVSNLAAAGADIFIFGRGVKLLSLGIATLALFVLSFSVSKLSHKLEGLRVLPPRLKKYPVDVVSWIGLITLFSGLDLAKVSSHTGLPMWLIIPLVCFAASLFSKTGSLLQKQALRDGPSLRAFRQPRYLRGVLGNLASQVLLAHVSVNVGITGVSVLRAFFSFVISTYTSLQEGEVQFAWKDGWSLIALLSFLAFLASRLM